MLHVEPKLWLNLLYATQSQTVQIKWESSIFQVSSQAADNPKYVNIPSIISAIFIFSTTIPDMYKTRCSPAQRAGHIMPDYKFKNLKLNLFTNK